MVSKKLLGPVSIGFFLVVCIANVALASPSSTPENDPNYVLNPVAETGVVLLSDDGNHHSPALVTHDADGITVDYGISNAMVGETPVPGDIYYSTVTITNDTADTWQLDATKSMGVSLWIYIQRAGGSYQTHEYYKKVIDEWMLFKFDVVTPENTTVPVSPYATVTDYAGSYNYHIPDDANKHVYPPVSLDGDYYAKATLPVSPIVLHPGETMRVPWWFGMAFDVDNGTQNMLMDFNFRLRFIPEAGNASPPRGSATPVPVGTIVPLLSLLGIGFVVGHCMRKKVAAK